MKLKSKLFLKVFSVILVFSIIISLFASCSALNSKRYTVPSVNEIKAENTDKKFHIYDKDSSIFVSKSGLIELYFDKTTYAVSVKDTAADKVWYSIPASETGFEQPSVLSVRLSDKTGNVYLLNSQDNSVAFDSATFNSLEGGITVTYRMALDRETASKNISEVQKGLPAVEITVEYSLSDGSFYVGIPDKGIVVPDWVTLESVTVLDYMTSASKAKKDDFLFIPDGCGALVMNALSKEDAEYSVPVYKTDGESPASAVVPAFGVKQGEAAYMALVESGDALSTVKAYTLSSSIGRAGVTFDVTDMKYQNVKNSKYTVYKGLRSGDDLRICYRFLAGKNASYSSFTTACREMLMRNSVISVSGVENTEYYPLYIAVDCAAAENKNGTKTRVLSSFEETEDILSQLKAKGINNAYVVLQNALTGADEQVDIKDAVLSKSLGSKDDYEALFSYANIQKMKLLLDIGLVTSNNGSSGFSSSDTLKTITGKKGVYEKTNAFGEISKVKKNTYKVLKPGEIDSRVTSLLRNFRKTSLSGYCINDYAYGFDIDYSTLTTASKASSMAVEANSSLATERLLAVKRGNFNSIKSAGLIVGLPAETGYEQSESYTAIPFVQMVLHGTADYTFEPINSSVDMQKALLKCVEYGALPSFEWFYRETGNELLDMTYKYDNSINIASSFYESASALNSLRSCRIVNHSCPQAGVYLTEYSDGSLVYVNYNEKETEVNEILIGAEDFVVIS